NQQGLTLPVVEYGHVDGACSVTGGFVYRGRLAPGLRGTYVYADYCNGKTWGISREGNQRTNRLLLSAGFNITSFGEDEAGELYVANASNGSILRVEGAQAPRLTSAGIVNAASFVPGMTPGSLGTVFVAGVLDDGGIVQAQTLPLGASLRNVSVSINGVAAPILALANQNGSEQVNFQTPFGLTGTTASVVVTRGANSSAAAQASIIDPQPAIYTSDGTQAIAVHNSAYTLVTNSRPLARGE